MNIPFVSLLFQGIPEITAVVILAFVIARVPLKWNKALLLGTILAFCVYVVRLLPIPFGSHTILLLFLLFIVLTRSAKGDAGLSFIACLVSLLALAIYEFTCFSLFMQITGFKSEAIFKEDLLLRILVGELQVLLLLFSAFLLNKFLHKRDFANFQ
jgi:hypothetical protein